MSVRFAPSPTGRFHVGNLRTAWISHELARDRKLPWVVRFEDIDHPRVMKGAREQQLDDLARLGLHPDCIIIQSENFTRHKLLFDRAVSQKIIYPCNCSRKEILRELEGIASAPHLSPPVYSGKCRNRLAPVTPAPLTQGNIIWPSIAWRFRDPDDPTGNSDFIVARTCPDGSEWVPAYHWACAIDDLDGEHSLLVRASDLKDAIRFQSKVFSWVAQTESKKQSYPEVFHTALITSNDGHRLEKRTRGVTLDELDPKRLVQLFEKSIQNREPEKMTLSELGLV